MNHGRIERFRKMVIFVRLGLQYLLLHYITHFRKSNSMATVTTCMPGSHKREKGGGGGGVEVG